MRTAIYNALDPDDFRPAGSSGDELTEEPKIVSGFPVEITSIFSGFPSCHSTTTDSSKKNLYLNAEQSTM